MAVGHYDFNPQTRHGALLAAGLAEFESGRAKLRAVIAALVQMKDGANLTSYAVGKFGFPDTSTATAALAELESAKAQFDGSSVLAAVDQMLAKFRSG